MKVGDVLEHWSITFSGEYYTLYVVVAEIIPRSHYNVLVLDGAFHGVLAGHTMYVDKLSGFIQSSVPVNV